MKRIEDFIARRRGILLISKTKRGILATMMLLSESVVGEPCKTLEDALISLDDKLQAWEAENA
jgi:hypothetical protein